MNCKGFKVEADKLASFNRAIAEVPFYSDSIAARAVFKSIVENKYFMDAEYGLIVEMKKNRLEITVKDKKTVIEDFFGK